MIRLGLIVGVFVSGCAGCRGESDLIELNIESPVTYNECIVVAGAMHAKRIELQMVCGSEADEESLGAALGFELELGDCLILGKEAFCLEEISDRRAMLSRGYDVKPHVLRRRH